MHPILHPISRRRALPAMTGGPLQPRAPHPERVRAGRDGARFVDGVQPGDVIAFHWSWACDRVSALQLAGLVAWTSRQVGIANRTI